MSTPARSSAADVRIVGSNVLADQGLTINAGRNLSIEAAQNSATSSTFSQTQTSGLMSTGGLSLTIGKQQ